MDADYWDNRIAQLKNEQNAILAQVEPGLSRMAFLQGQVEILQDMKSREQEQHKVSKEMAEKIAQMANETLGGQATVKTEPDPLPDLELQETDHG